MKLFSTSRETVYAGWDRPLLQRTVTLLCKRFLDGQTIDLSSLLCVLPSARGAARLETLLRVEATKRSLDLRPARVITIGHLAESLYQPTLPIALEFEQTLAWANVIREMHSDDLAPLIPTVPPPEPIAPWLELAGMLRRLLEELASNELSFAEVVEATETESENRRWMLLHKIHSEYQQRLKQAGLSDPHDQRRLAIATRQCQTDKSVVLIGTSDLSEALISMLRNLEGKVLSIVAAPESKSDWFNEFGCVTTPRWTEHELPLHDCHLLPAGGIAEQAEAAAGAFAGFADRYAAAEVTIGVTDESQVGPVEMQMRGCGVSTFRHLGRTVSQTGVGRLLNRTANYLQRQTWQSLAALVRHADVCDFVTDQLIAQGFDLQDRGSETWLTQLDGLLSNHFPMRLDKPLPSQAIAAYPLAITVGDMVRDWLADFSAADGKANDRTIAHWSRLINLWLSSLYKTENDGRTDVDRNMPPMEGRQRTPMAVEATLNLTRRFGELNSDLDLTVTGAAAIEMMSSRLADVRILDQMNPDDVAISGWLDLALDDAPAMVVVGLNHPFVPGATTNDPFLPGSLRTKLRMADNERRYARDIYVMHLILSVRKDVRFIVGKSGADGSPTPPSRLLAAATADDAARRLRLLLKPQRRRATVRHLWDQQTISMPGKDGRSQIPIPTLDFSDNKLAVKTMSVTAFRDYLACPYRFYLRHVLKLRPLDDSASELAANQFGDLVHGSLERFGGSPDRGEQSSKRIESMLLEHLHDYAKEHFGGDASTAVTIQVAQAERRLKAVAIEQARRSNEGWIIHASEASVDESNGAGVDVNGRRMGLRGRFDRIDFHPETGCWAILDYKTHGFKPEKKHLEKTADGYRWIDLQLPLYRMMIPFLGIDAPPDEVSLGYFNVSEKDDETRINLAEFTPSQMNQADQLIRDCIRGIWAGEFSPTRDRVQFDDYAMILQTGVASRMLDHVDSHDNHEISE